MYWGRGVLVIPRDTGCGGGRGASPGIFQTHETTTNRGVCAHLEAADGVPGAETVQYTDTAGSG